MAAKMNDGKEMPTAPLVVKNITDLKVGFTPSTVRTGKLIGAAPQGTMVNGAWTGIERYFELAGGYSRVSETDMAASGDMFFMNKAAINTTVSGKPAISMVYTDDRGVRVEEAASPLTEARPYSERGEHREEAEDPQSHRPVHRQARARS